MKKFMGVVVGMALLGLFSAQSFADDDVEKIFLELDANGDGYITLDEAEAHEDLPDNFEDADNNEDGRLDRDEFMKAEISDE